MKASAHTPRRQRHGNDRQRRGGFSSGEFDAPQVTSPKEIDGMFFTVRPSLLATNKTQSWKDVTKKPSRTARRRALRGKGAIAAVEA
jgi:hypothetical protein